MPTNAFEISPDTQALVAALAEISVGSLVTFEQLSACIGRDVREHRHLLYCARRVAERDNGIVFGSVRGVGLQRLTVEQIPHIGQSARRHIRSSAKRASSSIHRVISRANDASNETRLAANREISMLGLLQEVASNKHTAAVRVDDRPLPVAIVARDFLDRFNGKSDK